MRIHLERIGYAYAGQVRCRTDQMQDRTDAIQDGCRTGGCRTDQMQDMMDEG